MHPIRPEEFKGDEWISGLIQKLANPPMPSLNESICSWSDLLGFGSIFFKSNWNPTIEEWEKISKRILNAHMQCFSNLDPSFEFVMILNDGIIRCCNSDRFNHLDCLSMWLRSCIWTHNAMNEIEREEKYPGVRTILTAGYNLKYSHIDFRFDDFVFNYTKKDPTKLSSIAQLMKNPVVLINPGPLQMNIAFSKAYILDLLGTQSGIKGPHFYIDESFLLFVERLHKNLASIYEIINRKEKSFRLFAIPSRNDKSRYHLGLELEEPPISVKNSKIETRIWRLIGFYPWDEDVAEFKNPVH